jgi:hypothetical protein
MAGLATAKEEGGRSVTYVREHWWFAALLVLFTALGVCLVIVRWKSTPSNVRPLELRGWSTSEVIDAATQTQLRSASGDHWSYLGSMLLSAGGLLGASVMAGPLARRVSWACTWILLLLVPLHLAEHRLLELRAAGILDANPIGLLLQGVSFLGLALLPAAGLIAAMGGGTALLRLVVGFGDWRKARNHRTATLGRSESVGTSGASWRGSPGDDAHWRKSSELPPGRAPASDAADLGICLSGGGIRSATFAIGAMQAMQAPQRPDGSGMPSELSRARYLTGVSGGAYAAGAFLLAAHPYGNEREGDGATSESKDDVSREAPPDFDNVFSAGSPEFDYLRQHGSYLADGMREWATAVLTMLRGAFLATLFLTLLAIILGRWTGYIYRDFGRQSDLRSPWNPIWGAVLATLALALLDLMLWYLTTTAISAKHHTVQRLLRECVSIISIVVVVLVLLGAVVPIVTWASIQIINLSGGEVLTNGEAIRANQVGMVATGAAKGGIIGVLGVIITALGLLNRQRVALKKTLEPTAEKARKVLGDTGRKMVRSIPVVLGLMMIGAVYLIIFGFSTYTTAFARPLAHPLISWGSPQWELPFTNNGFTIVLTVMFLVIYLFVDETATGLHLFYRRRLASAFAVRRVASDPPGTFEARPYSWTTTTRLEHYGDPDEARDGRRSHPQVIFCASAHCSDPEKTPPGRHVLPFTFSFDALGGPEVGWCSVKKMRKVSTRLQSDLTVETAIAVSGAAFSSADGSNELPANVILALTNARLGTWVPNPEYMKGDNTEWWCPRPPKIRRMSYMLREIFSWHPFDFPMLFVTDGANYESLGLVELLRHRCTEIYCVDASSDSETFAAAIARAITLAYDELGVTVTVENPEMVDPRCAEETAVREDLKGRVAKKPILTGTMTYPSRSGLPEVTGTLVIGRATMDVETPWEILRYAAAHPLFPHDATGDQWFDDGKFNAYTGLGRHVGALAVQEMASRRSRVKPH